MKLMSVQEKIMFSTAKLKFFVEVFAITMKSHIFELDHIVSRLPKEWSGGRRGILSMFDHETNEKCFSSTSARLFGSL